MLSDIKKCFIPFCKTGNYDIKNAREVRVYFDEGVEYYVSKILFDSFHYHKGYNTVSNLFLILDDFDNHIPRTVEYFPHRGKSCDGQLKIAVDAILAVDALDSVEDVKILIVGSSHQPLFKPRSSYASLPHMLTGDSQIDMFDPYEEEGSEKIGRTIVNRIRDIYTYATQAEYDLVIDDAYSYGESANQSKLSELENFSVKSFSESTEFNNYFQVSHTSRSEVRVVSRSVIPDYYPNDRLGDCAFCRELKFYLRGRVYSDEVYYQFYLNHPFDQCRSRGYIKFRRQYHESRGNYKWEPTKKN
jgi:hypothetical protein